MAFPPDLLNQGEEVIVDIRPHWWYITPSALSLGLAIVIGLLIASKTGSGGFDQALRLGWGVVVLVALGWFVVRYSQWVSTNFVVTSDRVIYRVGVFAKRGTEIPVDKINAVHFDQRVFERMMGLGTLRIDSAAESGTSAFEDIRKPSAVQNLIHQQIDRRGDRQVEGFADAARAVNAGAGLSIPEQLEKLSELRDRGVITEEEYAAKKAQFLDRM